MLKFFPSKVWAMNTLKTTLSNCIESYTIHFVPVKIEQIVARDLEFN